MSLCWLKHVIINFTESFGGAGAETCSNCAKSGRLTSGVNFRWVGDGCWGEEPGPGSCGVKQWCSGKFGAGGTLGGLGAEPPAGSRGRAPGRRVRERSPLKLKAFFVFGYPKGGAIFHLTSKFRKLRKPH